MSPEAHWDADHMGGEGAGPDMSPEAQDDADHMGGPEAGPKHNDCACSGMTGPCYMQMDARSCLINFDGEASGCVWSTRTASPDTSKCDAEAAAVKMPKAKEGAGPDMSPEAQDDADHMGGPEAGPKHNDCACSGMTGPCYMQKDARSCLINFDGEASGCVWST